MTFAQQIIVATSYGHTGHTLRGLDMHKRARQAHELALRDKTLYPDFVKIGREVVQWDEVYVKRQAEYFRLVSYYCHVLGILCIDQWYTPQLEELTKVKKRVKERMRIFGL